MRTHGVRGWEEYPSYLDTVVPRVLRCCYEHDLRITVFVVGRDAELRRNHNALAALAAAGHEIGNHSLNHYPWLNTLSREQIEAEIVEAESLIEDATGIRPIGFRGPAYSVSSDILEVLIERGYLYDASTLPTFLGPLARLYVRCTSLHETNGESHQRNLFGSLRDGFLPIKPHALTIAAGSIVELPVTTMPILRLPIHMTYIVYLLTYSRRLAHAYFRLAITLCRLTGVRPSILLHPLDFLSVKDDSELSFFPGMNVSIERKRALIADFIATLQDCYDVQPLAAQAEEVRPLIHPPRLTRAATELPAPELVSK
jgi:peptidoglycan/xylan/chitin deacetylase (PgdA/CDA1 family)